MIKTVIRSFPTVLNLNNINPHLVKSQYAVRGEVAVKIAELDSKLRQGQRLPFSEVIQCNVGNPMWLGQRPLTWIRQGLSIMSYPELISENLFPVDIKERCRYLLSRTKGGVGAYTESQGLLVVRESVSNYISNRDSSDKVPPSDIFLSNGASSSIQALMTTTISSPSDCILTPIPQYPIYNAITTLQNGSSVGYFLDESDHKWSISKAEIQKSIQKAKSQGLTPKVLVVINPGNPTGQVLSSEVMKQIIQISEEENLVLMADEVYQDNVYTQGKNFHSFRKIAIELGSNIEIASFHTISKGFFGECGLRGGYMHLMNFDKKVQEQIQKLFTIMLPSNTLGQIALELAINPPKENEPSFEFFKKEKEDILKSLKEKALIMERMFNKMENIQCNDVEGAMYAFPRIWFSNKAKEVAAGLGMTPEKFYVIKLLEETGVALVPGCGFGQQDGTHHFRITTLPSNIDEVMKKIEKFNSSFHSQYKDN